MKDVNVKVIQADEELDELYKLRFSAWETRMNIKEYCTNEIFYDALDDKSLHWGIKEGFNLVAGASLHIAHRKEDVPYIDLIAQYIETLKSPYYTFRRLAALPEEQGRGLGISLVNARIRHIKTLEEGTAMTVVSDQTRIPNLLKFGFRQASDIGAFETAPGGPTTLLVASTAELSEVPNVKL